MALDITYYYETDGTGKCLGVTGPRATVSLTATPVDCGAIPAGAIYARLTAGEDTVFTSDGTTPGASNGQLIKTGAAVEVAISPQAQFKARTA